MKRSLFTLFVLSALACAGPAGDPGANGEDGSSCSVSANTDGTRTITCEDGTTATVSDGAPGEVGETGATGETGAVGETGETGAAGTSCSVVDNGDGSKTITCEDGTSVIVEDGADVDPATVEDLQAQLDALAADVEPESCAVCHADSGSYHQAEYNKYTDTSNIKIEIIDVTSVVSGTNWHGTMEVYISKNGQPYVDVAGLPTLQRGAGAQSTFYVSQYTNGGFYNSKSFSSSGAQPVAGNPGHYTLENETLPFDPANTDTLAYAYVAQDQLHTEGNTLYDNVWNTAKVLGSIDYDSTANVAGCEKCHGAPYMKHGYRAAAVENAPDFAACKTCHYDDRGGHHVDWQVLVDDPARYADIPNNPLSSEEKAKYGYVANVMNDVHMSHAMEFGYPQSMANCVTCHEGKLDRVLVEDNFRADVCLSCHARSGSEEYGTAEFAFEPMWAAANVTALHTGYVNSDGSVNTNFSCMPCHADSGTKSFKSFHSGYDKAIYDADGNRYSATNTVQIDSVTLTGDVLDIQFSGTNTDIVPTVTVSFYGYDSKDFLLSSHSADDRITDQCLDYRGNPGGCHMEKTIGSANPLFTEEPDSIAGNWHVSLDLAAYLATPTIPEQISAGVFKRAEVALMPSLEIGGEKIALNAVTRTVDLGTSTFDDGFFTPIVDVNKCNACHDALGTTFHSPNRGGSIIACRTCHVTTSGGSHLEMQSRSIDSYVHAIHSMQPFDIKNIDFTDPVQALRYEHHIESTYPNFTLMNCESCHNPGTFDVPSQAKSMPGLLSASSTVADREIGNVASVVTGPTSRACGACHRAQLINEDDANGLVALNAHVSNNGYMVENATGLLDTIISKIMAFFN